MNDQSSIINALPLRQQRRPRTWLSRAGAPVDDSATRVPRATSIYWEAYVVDSETNNAVEAFPRLDGVDVIRTDTPSTNYEIQKCYLTKLQLTQPGLDFAKLHKELDSGAWVVSTHIHSNKPLP